MSEPGPVKEPQAIEYASPRGRRTKEKWFRASQFWLGLLGGGCLSIVAYIINFRIDPAGISPLFTLCVIALAKVVAGVGLMQRLDRRSVGAGLLLSLVLGGLIFFGTCAENFNID